MLKGVSLMNDDRGPRERTIMECLEESNQQGRFQIILLVLNIFTSCASGYITFQMQSLSVFPKVNCLSDRCRELAASTTDQDLVCTTLVRNVDWTFPADRNNLLTEFSLYCDRIYLISLGTTIYFTGFFFAVGPLSSLVDRMGRKFSCGMFLLLHVIFLAANSLATSVSQIMVVRFILGALHGGISISMFVTFYEFTSEKVATFSMMLNSAAFSMGGGVAGFVSMKSQHWEQTMVPPSLVLTAVGIIFYFLVPETPHWLFSRGRERSALESLDWVARTNGYPALPRGISLISATGSGGGDRASGGDSFTILWRTPFFRRSLGCLAFVWFTVSICYYGLEFNAASLGNEYLVMILMGCFDLPFKLTLFVLASKVGRQRSSQLYLSLALCCLVLTAIPQTELIPISGNFTLKTVLVSSGRAFAGSVFALLYIYTSEILPTLVRSVGMSACSTAARVGSLLAPLVILVNELSPSIIYVFIVVCLMIAMGLLRKIPETLGHPLPNNLEDCVALFGKMDRSGEMEMLTKPELEK